MAPATFDFTARRCTLVARVRRRGDVLLAGPGFTARRALLLHG